MANKLHTSHGQFNFKVRVSCVEENLSLISESDQCTYTFLIQHPPRSHPHSHNQPPPARLQPSVSAALCQARIIVSSKLGFLNCHGEEY